MELKGYSPTRRWLRTLPRDPPIFCSGFTPSEPRFVFEPIALPNELLAWLENARSEIHRLADVGLRSPHDQRDRG